MMNNKHFYLMGAALSCAALVCPSASAQEEEMEELCGQVIALISQMTEAFKGVTDLESAQEAAPIVKAAYERNLLIGKRAEELLKNGQFTDAQRENILTSFQERTMPKIMEFTQELERVGNAQFYGCVELMSVFGAPTGIDE